ncbi:MAG: hypothetical protein F2923_07540 [Actinobacteria bacterium]|uniref:Unannotated protein n=1 Tax=freshwater metagenome TaxID=449393 RepID=A0A6J7SMK1_9ZZZZ|nr:hypothetical protein [Actinomycetota bacterium]MTB28476.1 hypothetical protein [Actinomycetota bacterium]
MMKRVPTVLVLSKSLFYRLRVVVSKANDRGDVPGWVLVAVMTAGLVTAIWLIADDALTSVFDRAMTSVSVRN